MLNLHKTGRSGDRWYFHHLFGHELYINSSSADISVIDSADDIFNVIDNEAYMKSADYKFSVIDNKAYMNSAVDKFSVIDNEAQMTN